MDNSKMKIPFGAPLSPDDTENQTYGCRQINPDICKYNMLDGVCAFCREDHICKRPSQAWEKQYMKLKGNQL